MKLNLIDHEEWKFRIALSSSVLYVIQQDMFNFGFYDEKNNRNRFINTIIKAMHQFRQEKNEIIKDKLLNTLSDKIKIKDNVNIDDIINDINDTYFDIKQVKNE